ncbi:hypothetical protein, partial [Achromobacter denitrificans]
MREPLSGRARMNTVSVAWTWPRSASAMRARPLMRAAAPAVEAVELAVGFAAELLPGLGAAFAIALAIEFAATLGAALAAPGAAGAAAAVAGA